MSFILAFLLKFESATTTTTTTGDKVIDNQSQEKKPLLVSAPELRKYNSFNEKLVSGSKEAESPGQVWPAGRTRRDNQAAAHTPGRLVIHNASNSSRSRVFDHKISVFRITNEYMSRCQELIDDHLRNSDALYRYLYAFGLSSAEPRHPAEIRFRKLQLERQCRQHKVLIRSSELISASPSLSVLHACAGIAIWHQAVRGRTMYSWDLFLFDIKTLPVRVACVVSELFTTSASASDKRHDKRYRHYVKSRERVLRTVIPAGTEFITCEHLIVDRAMRDRGVGTSLLKYGMDMADSQNLPIFVEVSTASSIKFLAKFGFKLVHELRLARRHEDEYCSVYCMLRQAQVKKLVTLPVM
ncbi:hypothetical protein V1514DRAFT_332195 [Lipomyces japonicus]|uniref:uncharacterized protein n=1 Tax=Lipomyces japonicus TaxID=56871 RepID=UPI0034CFF3E7